jgi:hypothetical protein
MHHYTPRRNGFISKGGGMTVMGGRMVTRHGWREWGHGCLSIVHCVHRAVYSVSEYLRVTLSEFKFT